MKYINLITSNKNKIIEYKQYADFFGIDLKIDIKEIEVPELQSFDPEEVVLSKVKFIQEKTTQPFILEDTSFITERYNNFPGTHAKFVNKTLGIEGWKRLFDEGDKIRAITHLSFSFLGKVSTFIGEIEGIISFKNLDNLNLEMPLNNIFFIESENDYLGNLIKRDTFHNHRKQAFSKFVDFVKENNQNELETIKNLSDKWSQRAEDWENELKNPDSYVNYEKGYDRFSALIKKFMVEISGEVLDIGCATGTIARQIAEKEDVNVIGIDISSEMINKSSIYKKANLNFYKTDFNQVFKESTFDFIVSRGVIISQIPELSIFDFFQSVNLMAKDGAYFIFDFIQNKENGNFPSNNVNEFSMNTIQAFMEELGWVNIYAEESETTRSKIVGFHKSVKNGVYFATGNPIKMEEFKKAIGKSDVELYFCGVNIEEIKSDSLEVIVSDKLIKSFNLLKKPVICTDGGIFINALNGFPGENSKQAAQKLGASGLLKLMEGQGDRSAVRRNSIGYYDGVKMEIFTSEIPCEISTTIREKYASYEIDKILIPINGENSQLLTYSEIDLDSRVALTELPQLAQFIQKLFRR